MGSATESAAIGDMSPPPAAMIHAVASVARPSDSFAVSTARPVAASISTREKEPAKMTRIPASRCMTPSPALEAIHAPDRMKGAARRLATSLRWRS